MATRIMVNSTSGFGEVTAWADSFVESPCEMQGDGVQLQESFGATPQWTSGVAPPSWLPRFVAGVGPLLLRQSRVGRIIVEPPLPRPRHTMTAEQSQITALLHQWSAGDSQ